MKQYKSFSPFSFTFPSDPVHKPILTTCGACRFELRNILFSSKHDTFPWVASKHAHLFINLGCSTEKL